MDDRRPTLPNAHAVVFAIRKSRSNGRVAGGLLEFNPGNPPARTMSCGSRLRSQSSCSWRKIDDQGEMVRTDVRADMGADHADVLAHEAVVDRNAKSGAFAGHVPGRPKRP